jgi:hypothetical protein
MAEGKRRDLASDSEEDDEDQLSDGSEEAGSDEEEDGDSDFDSNFAELDGAGKAGKAGKGGAEAAVRMKEVVNQPYDAKVDLEDSFSDESVDTQEEVTPKMRALESGKTASAGAGANSAAGGKKAAGKAPAESPSSSGGGSPPRGGSPKAGRLSDDEEIPGVRGEGKRPDPGVGSRSELAGTWRAERSLLAGEARRARGAERAGRRTRPPRRRGEARRALGSSCRSCWPPASPCSRSATSLWCTSS